LILNFKVLDYDSGFVAARKDVLQKMRLSDSGYGEYCIEFLYKAGEKGYKIEEVPYSFVDRRAGESKTAESLYGLFKFGIMYLKKIFILRLKK
jgi:dolichol-phosphate mannosyltransferase